MDRTRVIDPPDPIVTPADIPGSHAADDASVAAVIQAVTEEIDGPGGWLGRSLGPQTLELSTDCWRDRSIRLPFGPVIGVDSFVYLDSDGEEQAIDDAAYGRTGDLLWFRPAWSAPALADEPNPIRITYRAGYDGEDVAGGGTGPVPERARQAIIIAAQDLLRGNTGAVRSETVEGVGSTTYLDTDKAAAIVRKTCERLLSTLRVFA